MDAYIVQLPSFSGIYIAHRDCEICGFPARLFRGERVSVFLFLVFHRVCGSVQGQEYDIWDSRLYIDEFSGYVDHFHWRFKRVLHEYKSMGFVETVTNKPATANSDFRVDDVGFFRTVFFENGVVVRGIFSRVAVDELLHYVLFLSDAIARVDFDVDIGYS